uniref:Uncharacterized protein n=1 Tax=Arundo donax TaxID=35708 RepID=A0A0A9G3R6_ARUDO
MLPHLFEYRGCENTSSFLLKRVGS